MFVNVALAYAFAVLYSPPPLYARTFLYTQHQPQVFINLVYALILVTLVTGSLRKGTVV